MKIRVFYLFVVLGLCAMQAVAQAEPGLPWGRSASSVPPNPAALQSADAPVFTAGAPLPSSPMTKASSPLSAKSIALRASGFTTHPPMSTALESSSDESSADDSSSKQGPEPANGPGTSALAKPVEPPQKDTHVRWMSANKESLLSTGIMHTFNLWTEAGTRDALYGPWFQNWMRSVGELRGWSDSDRFMAPYAGHPIQGAIFGYIFRQNDPRYSDVQWGDGRDYYVSLLRSMGYSALWHTQWKIGPASEASIGNVMLHASPGFITLVDTPLLGTVDMMGEDALDRYVIMGLENRTANRTLIMLTRCFLNPGRSFGNVMAFRVPWARATRMGIFGESFVKRQDMIADWKHHNGPKPFEFVKRQPDASSDPNRVYPKAAPIELSAYANFEVINGRNCIGGGGSGAARLSPNWQFVGEVNGCLIMGFSKYTQSGDSLFYGGGPRWTPLATHKWSPFAEVLFGGRKVTYEVDNLDLENTLFNAWNDGSGTLRHYPKRIDWSTQVASNGPSLAVGGGLDYVVKRPFAWRLINIQYTHSWMGGVDNIHPDNGIRVTTEAVLRIGTW